MKHTIVSSSAALDRLDPSFHIANDEINWRVEELQNSLCHEEVELLAREIALMMTPSQQGKTLDPLRRTRAQKGLDKSEFVRILTEYPYQTLALLEAALPEFKRVLEDRMSQSESYIKEIDHIQAKLLLPKPTLFLVRGAPGSGKSTYAKLLLSLNPNATHIENDAFFTDANGHYAFDITKHEEAKDWCLRQAQETLNGGRDAIVSNTFTTLKEMQPYLDLGYPVGVVEMELSYTDTHQVPKEVIEVKKKAFEPYPGATRISNPNFFRPSPRFR